MKGNIIYQLKTAINEVPAHYYELENPPNVELIDYSKQKVYPERNYCTNLYCQLMKKLQSEKLSTGEDFFLDAEIYKKCVGTYIKDDKFKKTKDKISISNRGLRPDLVLHASQSSRKPGDQLLILECKISNNIKEYEFNKDYFKLNIFKSQLNFKAAALLIVNNTRERIEGFIENYKRDCWTCNDVITVLIKESFDSNVEQN